MKLPKKVKIANHIFNIIDWHPDIASAKQRFGECDCDQLTIRVSTIFPDSHVKETLLHEINHAIFWAYNIKSKDNEERIVTMVSVGLSQVLQDNPKIHKFLSITDKR